MQIPTIGRIVHFVHSNTHVRTGPPIIRAAIITEVDTADDPTSTVGLAIFNPTCMFFNCNVPFGDLPGQWHWPPLKMAIEDRPSDEAPPEGGPTKAFGVDRLFAEER